MLNLSQLAINLPAVPSDVRIKPPASADVNPAFLDFNTGIPLVLDAGIIIAAAIMIILIAIGGLQYMLASGNEEASTKARRLMFGSVVGFALILGTWAIVHLIFGFVGYSFG